MPAGSERFPEPTCTLVRPSMLCISKNTDGSCTHLCLRQCWHLCPHLCCLVRNGNSSHNCHRPDHRLAPAAASGLWTSRDCLVVPEIALRARGCHRHPGEGWDAAGSSRRGGSRAGYHGLAVDVRNLLDAIYTDHTVIMMI